ncbi:hypothetical protein [uncultured Metabacillus sp.]|nr:hypothetical protein [uncultured Metabacillus sp.]
MAKECKLTLSDFVNKDRFELNSYLTYLFNEYYDNQLQAKEKYVKQ